ncbi:hypothetical protein ACUIJQ_03350 [Levilactobacillus hammesii]|nr:hypothetical protein [Levilactobacillus hammesii]
MKRYIKHLMSVVLLGTAILSLSACGKSGANQVNEKNVSFIKDAQSSNQRIWYMVESDSTSDYELSKDTHITQILVTKNGKATVYNMPDNNFSMRDINGKSDDQVLTIAQKKDREYYKDFIDPQKDILIKSSYIQNVIKNTESDYKHYEKHPDYLGATHKESLKKLREYQDDLTYLKANEASILKNIPKYEKPTPKLLNAKVKTDNSGNDVNYEDITHRRLELETDSAKLKHLHWVDRVDAPTYYNFTMTDGFQLIYDKPVKILSDMYTGYTNPTNDSKTTSLLTKTTNKDTVSDFDKLGTKHVSEEN